MSQPDFLPPHVAVIQMGTGHWVARIVWAAAELGLADHVGESPTSIATIASTLNLHAHSLYRLFRTLEGFGIFSLDADGTHVHHTPMSETLRTGAPGSARSTIRVMTGQAFYGTLLEFLHSLRTGETAFAKHNGKPLFDYLADHPHEASMFSEAMMGIHGTTEPPAVTDAYDFSQFETIIDIGGANGNMLGHILRRYPTPRGIVFDLPHVVAEAPANLAHYGVADRVTTVPGSFFESAPAGGDAYILSHIVHDWSVEQNLTILGHIRKAMKPTSKLLIVEFVLPEGATPHFGKLADMVMLAYPGGEERTARGYADLLAKAGFALTRVVPTASDVSIVEATIAN